VTYVWDLPFEQRSQALVRTVVEQRGPDRLKAWQQLLAAVAPHIERWAAQNPTLRALRLTSEDETRSVLVRVVERLQRGQHANLRMFLEARLAVLASGPESGDGDGRAVQRFAAVAVAAGLCEDESAETSLLDDTEQTPLRAWLKGLVAYVAHDHAAARLGRGQHLNTPGDTGPLDKRRMHSDAKRITESDAGWVRPPITDLLTLKRIAAEVQAFVNAKMPVQLKRALELRLDEHGYEEIAAELLLKSATEAEQLVRAAKERLRAEFRHQRERFGLEADE
jgi:hypothetical protein